nr:polysaccharide pyruvyl transferase family protein [Gemmobacter straminiformis]
MEALFGPRGYDGVLIGGGNIIHARPVTLPDYAECAEWAYGALWLGAALAGARRGVPVLWNAPGVPHAFEPREAGFVAAALAASGYVAVRDAASAAFLAPFQARVVPDTALGLARLWPKAGLAADFRRMVERTGADGAARFLAVHVKARSVAGPVEGLAPLLDAVCAKAGLVPVLIGIGACHGDDVATDRLAAAMTGPRVNLSRPEGLREIAAAIAFSQGYVGASMHGYVTAAAYGVAGVIVGRPKLVKMAGVLAHLGRPQDEVADWAAALALTEGFGPREMPASVTTALDAHWRALAEAVLRPVPIPAPVPAPVLAAESWFSRLPMAS